MSFQCCLHLHIITILRIDKVRADKKKDDTRLLEMFIDVSCPLRAGTYHTIVPCSYQTLVLKHAEMLAQFLSEPLICVGVGHEDRYRLLRGRQLHGRQDADALFLDLTQPSLDFADLH